MTTDNHIGTLVIKYAGGSMTVRLGQGHLDVSGGLGGGFETIDRPRRVGLVDWTGHAPLEVSIPVILGDPLLGGTIRADNHFNKLLSLLGRGGSGGEPETVELECALLPIGSSLQWYLSDFSVEEKLHSRTGRLERCIGTLTFIQASRDTNLISEARKWRMGLKGATKTYKTRKGDTWKNVSKRFYKTTKHDGVIRKANSKVKADKKGKLPVGKTLKIPPQPKG